MNTRLFENHKYTLEDIINAVNFGWELHGGDNREHIPIDLIKEYLSKEIRLSAEEWQNLTPEIKVINHDGWEKKDFKKRWYSEEITYNEYINRRDHSTCIKQ